MWQRMWTNAKTKQIKSTHVAYFSLMSTFLDEFWRLLYSNCLKISLLLLMMVILLTVLCFMLYTQCCCACVLFKTNNFDIRFWPKIYNFFISFSSYLFFLFFFFILSYFGFFLLFFTFFTFFIQVWTLARISTQNKNNSITTQIRKHTACKYSVMHLQVKYFKIDTNASKMWFIWCNSVKRNEKEKRNPVWKISWENRYKVRFLFGQTWYIQSLHHQKFKPTHQPPSPLPLTTKWPVYGCVLLQCGFHFILIFS